MSIILALLLIVSVCLLLPILYWLHFSRSYIRLSLNGAMTKIRASVPFIPEQHWLWGAIPFITQGQMHVFFEKKAEKMGWSRNYGLFFLTRVNLVINDPRDHAFLLGAGQAHFGKPTTQKRSLGWFFGDSMLMSEGERWRRLRKLFNPAFHFDSINKTGPIIASRTQLFMRRIERTCVAKGEPMDFATHVQNLTQDVLGLVAFDFDFNCQEDETLKFRHALDDICLESTRRFRRILPRNFYFLNRTTLAQATHAEQQRQSIVDAVDSILKKRMSEGQALLQQTGIANETGDTTAASSSNKSATEKLSDLLGFMVKAKLNGEDWITREDMVNEMLLFLFAGSDTTSYLIASAAYFCTRYPEAATKLYAEIDAFAAQVRASNAKGVNHTSATSTATSSLTPSAEHTGDGSEELGSVVASSSASNAYQGSVDPELDIVIPSSKTSLLLPYLNAFIKETLRLAPSAPIVGREALHPVTLPSGLYVEPGCILTVSPYVVHRSRELWGDDASEFKPERWLGNDSGSTSAKLQPNAGPQKVPLSTAFIPFVAGQRNCIGQNLARLESAIVLAMLLQRYQFELQPGPMGDVKTYAAITMHYANGLWLKITRRK